MVFSKQQPHSKLLTDLERFSIVIKQSVSLPGSVDGLQNRDLGDELRKLKVSCLLNWSRQIVFVRVSRLVDVSGQRPLVA